VFLQIFRPISVGVRIEGDGVEGAMEELGRAILLMQEGLAAVPNPCPEMPADVEVLDVTERCPNLALSLHTHTSHCWKVNFDTNWVISVVLGNARFPVPRHSPGRCGIGLSGVTRRVPFRRLRLQRTSSGRNSGEPSPIHFHDATKV
jgi:hypothetical protein